MIPAVRVDLYTGEVSGDYLTLDDPVKGELDEALYPLYDGPAPELTVAIEADAYAYSVRRGRSSELDDVSVGTLAIEFRNHGGALVPNSLVESAILDEAGDAVLDEDGYTITAEWATYGYDLVTPGKRVRLYLDEVVVFDGRVDDWMLTYDVNGDATARLVAIDALGLLAQTELAAWTTSAQTASERFVAVLDRPEVGYGASRKVDEADRETDLGADVVAVGTNALTYVKVVTYSELGYTYASRDGLLVFEPRRSLAYSVQASFADDGTAIPFSDVRPASMSRYLFNRVSVTRLGGVEQVAEDATSQATYGIRTLTLSDLLMNADADALLLAQSLLSFYKSPTTRIESIAVNLGSLTSEQRSTVLSLELGDFVSLTWTPKGTEAVTRGMRVEGIDLGGTYSGVGVVTLSLSPASYFPTPFLLDDAAFGVLDTSQIFY